jgi:two-component system, NtrC family, sensor kinase
MLNQWHHLSLQVKITVIVIVIVGTAAGATEWFEARSVQRIIEGNVQDAALAVGRSVDKNVTSLVDLSAREARTKELDKIVATLPDLLTIVLYEFPTESGMSPLPVASVGFTESLQQGTVPALIQRVREERQLLIDYSKRTQTHRVFMAAPVFGKDAVVGATYAEFSTLQMDTALESLRRDSTTRRLLTGTMIVIAINLFLHLKVHRPVKRLLTAVESVSRGTMTLAVPVEEQDELGELAATFNNMVEKLQKTTYDNTELTKSLQAMNDSLQAKVSEATAEVLEKNEALVHTNELLLAAQRDAARAQRLAALGQMAATVAHKIGTPLTALSGHIQLMAEDSTLSRESRQRLQTVEAQIERTSKIIQDLLWYARKPDPERSPLDLNASVAECLTLFQPEFHRQNITLTTEWSHQIGKIQADALQLHEVFHSLIENALDAMPDGGALVVRIFPYVESGQPDGRTWVAVELIDTGCGMNAAQLAQIFQPFFTTKRAGRGTGLGLPSALETVRAHGGDIKVESESDKGARFTIVLPSDGGTR